MRAHLALCLWRDMDARTAMAAGQLMSLTNPRFSWGLEWDALVDRARGVAATKFLMDKNLGDCLMMVDSDMVFQPADAVMLVKDVLERDMDIAGAAYVTRSSGAPHPAVRIWPGQRVEFDVTSDPVPIQYLSTGFIAIHRRVLERMAETMELAKSGPDRLYPFFLPWVYQGEYLSEDWAFCQRALDLGFKVWLEPRIRLRHMGERAFVLEDVYQHAGDQMLHYTVQDGEYDPTNILGDLAVFLGVPKADLARRLYEMDTRQPLAKEWKENPPATPADVEKFYQGTDGYLLELARFNLQKAYWWRVHKLLSVSGRVVDFGGGIGTMSLVLEDRGRQVCYVELPSVHRQFAEFRFRRHGKQVEIYSNIEMVHDADAILAADVMEHIHPEALPDLCRKMAAALKPAGKVLCVSDWTTGPDLPQHFIDQAGFESAMRDAGFVGGPDEWIKEEPDGRATLESHSPEDAGQLCSPNGGGIQAGPAASGGELAQPLCRGHRRDQAHGGNGPVRVGDDSLRPAEPAS